jgi:hypothetical protein
VIGEVVGLAEALADRGGAVARIEDAVVAGR